MPTFIVTNGLAHAQMAVVSTSTAWRSSETWVARIGTWETRVCGKDWVCCVASRKPGESPRRRSHVSTWYDGSGTTSSLVCYSTARISPACPVQLSSSTCSSWISLRGTWVENSWRRFAFSESSSSFLASFQLRLRLHSEHLYRLNILEKKIKNLM